MADDLRTHVAAQVRAWALDQIPRMLATGTSEADAGRWLRSLLHQFETQGLTPPGSAARMLGGRIKTVRLPRLLAPLAAEATGLWMEHGWLVEVGGVWRMGMDAVLSGYIGGGGTAYPDTSPTHYEHIWGLASAGTIAACLEGAAYAAEWTGEPGAEDGPEIDASDSYASQVYAAAGPAELATEASGLTVALAQARLGAGRTLSSIVPTAWQSWTAAADPRVMRLRWIGLQRCPATGEYWLSRASSDGVHAVPLTVDPQMLCYQAWLLDGELTGIDALAAEAAILGTLTLDPAAEILELIDAAGMTGFAASGSPLIDGWAWSMQRRGLASEDLTRAEIVCLRTEEGEGLIAWEVATHWRLDLDWTDGVPSADLTSVEEAPIWLGVSVPLYVWNPTLANLVLHGPPGSDPGTCGAGPVLAVSAAAGIQTLMHHPYASEAWASWVQDPGYSTYGLVSFCAAASGTYEAAYGSLGAVRHSGGYSLGRPRRQRHGGRGAARTAGTSTVAWRGRAGSGLALRLAVRSAPSSTTLRHATGHTTSSRRGGRRSRRAGNSTQTPLRASRPATGSTPTSGRGSRRPNGAAVTVRWCSGAGASC